jgi:hypothetical protein
MHFAVALFLLCQGEKVEMCRNSKFISNLQLQQRLAGRLATVTSTNEESLSDRAAAADARSLCVLL